MKKFTLFLCIFIVILLAIVLGLVAANSFYPNIFKSSHSLGQLMATNEQIDNNIADNDVITVIPNDNNNETTNSTTEIPLDLPLYDFYFELPLHGATGYASVSTKLTDSPSSSKVLKTLSPGSSFQILSEER